MKKTLVLIGALALSSFSAFGAACSTTTSVYTLNGLGATGCEFGGLTFNNFFFSNYQDNAYSNSGTYTVPTNAAYIDERAMINGTNMQNYIVNFTQNGSSSVTVTLTPGTVNGWNISLPFAGSNLANFAFELKYNVAPSTVAIASVTGRTDVTVTGTPQFDNSLLQKGGLVNGIAPINNVGIGTLGGTIGAGSYTFTGTVPNSNTQPGQFIQTVDNYVSQIAIPSTTAPGASLNTTAIANTFNFVPEPMSMGLMGAGLVGLALLRRRSAKK